MRNFIFLFVFIISMSGCLKKEDMTSPKLPDYQPEIGVPLIKSRLTIKDFVREGDKGDFDLNTEANGLYYITYTNLVHSASAANIVQVPDQSIVIPGFPLTDNQSLNHTLEFQNQGTLTKADIKSGSLVMDMTTSNLVQDFTVTLAFPTVLNKSTGAPFTATVNSGMRAYFSLTADFSGYDIHFDANNQIRYTISITGASTGTLSANINISNVQYSVLYGSFNNIPIGVMSGESKLDIFDNMFDGNIYFANPSIELKVSNSFGVPININKQYFRSTYRDNTTDEIDAGDLEPDANKIIAPAPTLGSEAVTTLLVNNSNSTNDGGKVSLTTTLSKGPQKVSYEANPILINHDGFIKDDSNLDIVGTVKLPFHGKVILYAFQDTNNFNFNNIKELEFAEFIVGTDNNIPIELNLQVYFVNSHDSYKKLDSMFVDSRPLLKSPVIDNDGNIITSGTDKRMVLFTNERLQKISNADKILIKAAVNTANAGNQDVKIFDHNYLDLRISLHAKANINLNE